MFTVLLVCAVLASLAAGVLAAYGVCVGLFALLASQSRVRVASQSQATASPSTT